MADADDNPIYPSSDLDRPEKILTFLGSLWATTFQGMNQVISLTAAKAALEQQTYLQLLQLVATTSRFEVPLFQTQNWYFLRLKESELNTGESALAKYGEDYTYGVGQLTYGEPVDQELNVWDLNEPLVKAPIIMNRISDASRSFHDQADYVISNGAIFFRENPFDDPKVAQRELIASDGTVEDREVGLWVFRGDFDYEVVYEQFGYVLQTYLSSTENYKLLINAVMDALVEGTALNHVEELFSAVTGIPLVQETSETVERVITEVGRKLVITDQHVYRFSETATILVTEGDTVVQGEAMSDGLTVYDFQRGDTPSAEAVPAIVTSRGFLAEGYFSELTWENKDVTLTQETVDGRVRVSWELGGWPGDVEQFFDELHEKGLADGTTLAQLLDTRPDPSGEPPPGALPTTINPVSFLAENVLRNNGVLIVIKQDQGYEPAGLRAARLLRRIIPPHVLLLILTVVPVDAETITMDGAGDEEEPGYEEEVVSYSAGVNSETMESSTYVSESVIGRSIGGRCT